MIHIENDKVKLDKVGYCCQISLNEFSRLVYVVNQNGCIDAHKILTNEFRERFAKAVSEFIVANWDELVFDETHENIGGDVEECYGSIYILRKKRNGTDKERPQAD